MDARFEVPAWDEVYAMLRNQARMMRKDCFQADVILAVSRGGLIPARIHSDLLENSNIFTLQTEYYVSIGETKSEPTLRDPLSVSVDDKRVLVVDDVADSGKSLQLVKEHVIERGAEVVKAATLFRKPWSTLVPDYFEKETDRWVVFPWDLKETVRKAFEKRRSESSSQLAQRLADSGLPFSLVLEFSKELCEEEPC